MSNKYIIRDGTSYKKGTPEKVIEILDRFMNDKSRRLRLDYGDKRTGKNWGETNDIVGYIGRSSGKFKIPLLIKTINSHGGGAILTDSIIKIEYANKELGGLLYKHPKYHK